MGRAIHSFLSCPIPAVDWNLGLHFEGSGCPLSKSNYTVNIIHKSDNNGLGTG